jgi:UDP-N-acetylmuramoyl-tripeptide--D-alanyl-D-alanine ligase
VEARSLNKFVNACAGKLLKGSETVSVSRVSTDSRQTRAGDLFIALRGERFDGHEFLETAAEQGASALLIEQKRIPAKLPKGTIVSVGDTRKALGKIAAAYRKDFSLPIIAVGGSNGKTTTKDLIASVLRQKISTLHSDASFNNDIGVPLTLLRLEKTHAAAVMEVGTNHPGELAPLVKMIRPKFGVITSIGREHLEFFSDLSGVAEEEGVLAELLPTDGKLFLNGDSEWTSRIAERTAAQVVRVGFDQSNAWRAGEIRYDKHGIIFRVDAPQKEFCGEYKVRLLGRHQAINVLFAITLGAEFGLAPAEVRRGLEACEPPKMRCQLWEAGGVRVLDDCYNANADSMLAALQTLMDLPCKGRRIAVLGDMAELGAQSEQSHEEVGRRAAELGVGQLIAVGKMAPVLARAAKCGGLNRVFEFPDVESAASAVKSLVKSGDLVLLKASRATRLERIAEALRGGEPARKAA